MSEAAKAARKANKAKALRLTSASKDKVDASDFVAQPDINAGIKTGARPISKRAFKRGGKVEGVKAHAHAGRKARKSGGKAITADTLINRNVKEANEDREGIKHIGAFKKGGKVHRAHKKTGGSDGITKWLKDHESDYDDRTGAGAITDDQGNDYDPNQDGDGKKRGGRAKKLVGGPAMGDMQDPRVMAQAALAQSNRGQVPVGLLNSVPTTSRMSRSAGLKTGGKAEHPDEAQDKKLVRQMVKMSALTGKKHGGHLSVSDGEMEGTRPTGGRLARATGGKTGKGKTNINIVISPHGAGQQMPPQGGMPPMPPRPAGVPMPMTGAAPAPQPPMPKIGRASCRERV